MKSIMGNYDLHPWIFSAARKLKNKEELYLPYKMPVGENRSFYRSVLFLR